MGRKRHRWLQLVTVASSIDTWSHNQTPSVTDIMSTKVLSSINSPTISLAQLTWALIVSSSPVVNRDTLSIGNTQSSCYHLSTDIEIQLCSGTYFSYSAIFFKTQVWYASVPFSLVSTPIDNFFWPASHDDSTWIPGNIEWSPCVQWWWYHDQKLKYAQYCSWFPNNICYKWWVNDCIRNRTSSPPWTCSGSLHWIIKGISGFPTETMMPREFDASSKYQWSLSTKLVCEPSDGTALRAAFNLYPILTDWSNLISLKLLTDHIFHRSISTFNYAGFLQSSGKTYMLTTDNERFPLSSTLFPTYRNPPHFSFAISRLIFPLTFSILFTKSSLSDAPSLTWVASSVLAMLECTR